MTTKIGVFDSGMGGLTVFENLVKNIPNCDYIYLADEKNVPYGTKSDDELLEILKEVIAFFQQKKVDLIVIACNTASTYIDELKKITRIPLVGMIDITSKEVLKHRELKKVLLLATNQTVKHHKYDDILTKAGITVRGFACPNFVTYIENDYQPKSKYQDEFIQNELLKVKDETYDAVILGCTHFGLVKNSIQKVFKEALIISCEEATSCYLKEKIQANDSKKGSIEIYTSGDVENFNRKLKYFKGLPKSSKRKEN